MPDNASKVFCSAGCEERYKLKTTAYEHKNTIQCIQCGAVIDSTNYTRKYCSEKCRNEYVKKHEPEYPEAEIGYETIRSFNCKYCGREVVVTVPYDLRRSFCRKSHGTAYKAERDKERRRKHQGCISSAMSLSTLMRRECYTLNH
jgi:endogenous inhibitor of DNA gyrase (YacG/DUF329 family)